MIPMMIVGMALVTYLTRAPLMVLLRGDLPSWLRRWLQFVPIAVFSALVIPPFVSPSGYPELTPRLIVAAVAALVAWRTQQVYLTVVVGLLVFAVLR